MSRRICSRIPDFTKNHYDTVQKHKQTKINGQNLSSLQPGDVVSVRHDDGWTMEAQVETSVAPRSYNGITFCPPPKTSILRTDRSEGTEESNNDAEKRTLYKETQQSAVSTAVKPTTSSATEPHVTHATARTPHRHFRGSNL